MVHLAQLRGHRLLELRSRTVAVGHEPIRDAPGQTLGKIARRRVDADTGTRTHHVNPPLLGELERSGAQNLTGTQDEAPIDGLAFELLPVHQLAHGSSTQAGPREYQSRSRLTIARVGGQPVLDHTGLASYNPGRVRVDPVAGASMNIVIVGAGEVGTSVARHLVREGHDVTVVDKQSTRTAKISESLDVMTYTAQGASMKVLREVGAGHADLFIAVSNNDEVNLLSAIIAKRLGVATAVARTSDADHVDPGVGFSTDILGIDLVVCPEILTAAELSQVLRYGGALAIERFAQNRVEMIQLLVTEGTAPTKRPLKELRLPRGALVVAVQRESTLMIPGGNDQLQANDEAFVIGRAELIKEVEEIFGKKRLRKKRHIVLVGASALTRNLVTAMAKEETRITVIDEDPDACGRLADEMDIHVVHGDATDSDLLREEGVDQADVFAALTREDELNLLSTLLAKQLNVRRTLALVQKTEYAPIYRKLGVDATICPWLLVANQILKYVRPSELVSVSLLEGGRAEVLELRARKLSRIVGTPLRDLEFPRGAIIGAVSRDSQPFVPGGNDTVEVGDLVVVFALPHVRKAVTRLFGERHWFVG